MVIITMTEEWACDSPHYKLCLFLIIQQKFSVCLYTHS